jgi:hypothetical protein
MAEQFARLAEEPNRWPHERACLLHLSQSWAVFAWATELFEQHGANASLISTGKEAATLGPTSFKPVVARYVPASKSKKKSTKRTSG